MIAEILSTGDEVATGAIVDSNSAYIAEKLEQMGIAVVRHTCVKDDTDSIASVLREIGSRSDIAVVTGGLGPTADDLTAAAAAGAAGVDLKLDAAAMASIETYFKERQRLKTDTDRKQAMLPAGAECIVNPVGTAPGFSVKIGTCMFFFMPGVPYEMETMLAASVMPRIEEMRGTDEEKTETKTLCLFGLPEAGVGEKLSGFEDRFSGIKLGFRATFPVIQVKLYARGDNQRVIDGNLGKASEWILERIGKWVFSVDGDTMESEIHKALTKRKETLAVAESCTGGLISHLLTNVSGSSDFFIFSGVTYSNQAKIDVLGVSRDTLETYGAVHEETVKEMALGARKVAGATYGLATSGIAGPTGGTADKPVGTVCIGVASPDSVTGSRYHFSFGRRSMNKKIFAVAALEMLRREILGKIERG